MYKGNLKNVKLAFMGDITSNVANSLMLFGSRLGMEIALVGPKEMIPNSIYFNKSREYGTLDTFASLDEGLEDADIVYTDTFSGMGKSNPDEARLKSLSQYRLTKEAMQKADSEALVMHCLPVHRGVEVDADVIDGPKSIIWQQAKNKMLLAKAILLYLSKGR
jgi:ornithine carbamoyltransferase